MYISSYFFPKCVVLQTFLLVGIYCTSDQEYDRRILLLHEKEYGATDGIVVARSSVHRLLENDSMIVVPTFTLNELQSGARDSDLLDTLTSTGLLAVRVPINTGANNNDATRTDHHHGKKMLDEEDKDDKKQGPHSPHRHLLAAALCHCSDKIGPQIHGGEKILLSDGVTTRSTIATATDGSHHPRSLPKEEIDDICGPETFSSLEKARDYVSRAASGAFIPALDRLIIQNHHHNASSSTTSRRNSILLSTQTVSSDEHNDYSSVSSIVEDSVHLEHFHVYSKKEQHQMDQEDTSTVFSTSDVAVDHALDWHTDGGLFLAFLPAELCNNQDTTTRSSTAAEDDSFRIKILHDPHHSDGAFTEVRAVFPPSQQDGEVIVAIMLGEGAETWLNTPESLKLRATRHAVKMRSGESRAWYGMMHLVPPNAIVIKSLGTTFSQLRKTSKPHLQVVLQDDADDYGASMVDASMSISSDRRNLIAHVGGPNDCNNLDSFYCWMICQEIPDNGNSFQENVDTGKSLYCLDPGTLNSTNDVGQAVAACTNSTTGVVGSVMKKTCANYWYEAVENVQSYTNLYTGTTNGTTDDGTGLSDTTESSVVERLRYCYGKTDMYMKGFEWEATTCLVYLFQTWIISTRLELVGACIGTIALGFLVEATIRHRRRVLNNYKNGKKKMILSASLYGAQLVSSYLIMLLIMTYSGPLFISVIFGLVIGHVANNWLELTDGSRSGRVGIEGSTPCCANYLDNGDNKESIAMENKQDKVHHRANENDCCHCL